MSIYQPLVWKKFDSMNIAITGSSGMLGSSFASFLKFNKINFFSVDRKHFSINRDTNYIVKLNPIKIPVYPDSDEGSSLAASNILYTYLKKISEEGEYYSNDITISEEEQELDALQQSEQDEEEAEDEEEEAAEEQEEGPPLTA